MIIKSNFDKSIQEYELDNCELDNFIRNIVALREMEHKYKVQEEALKRACKLLKKAGVVYRRVNGKPVRFSWEAWYDRLIEDAESEVLKHD